MELSNTVDRYIDRFILEAFERIDEDRGLSTPKEVEEYIEKAWGFGEAWKEWWMESGEEYY